ncbi:holo-ACP synthase [Puia sp.]|jgi:phosphopantetheine--protein transferase-like protein|uniref:holo-ACP synthase n=1 Tax=Puia sp. TaxID=2045100 RepID=UPI002F422BB8
MEGKLKEIVSAFIRVPAEQIGAATPVDRRAVKSSIMLHRMYARLAEEGFVVKDYASVRVFGDLFGAPKEVAAPVDIVEAPAPTAQAGGVEPIAMGIDIESIDSMPRAADFRSEEFYKMNFTPREIAYCILQADPYSSFAGLFAAKEALVKADGSMREKPYNQLGIGHSPEGKPLYPGFTLSIAHANGTAVAVAARGGNGAGTMPVLTAPAVASGGRSDVGSWVAWLALLLAAATLTIVLLR